jgi:molybdopterin synthase catalytic subunit
MRVRVLFFGGLKDLAGKSSDLLELSDGALVRDVLTHYQAQVPGLEAMVASLAVAVNQEYAAVETRLKSDDEVALLPPVSGGSGRALIVRDPIDTQGVLARLKQGGDGAAVVFEGVVRNQTRGRRTLSLDYEAYEEMALRQMESLAEQALKQFQVREVRVVHRLGR